MSRPVNCAITFFTILVSCIICGDSAVNWSSMLLGGLVGVFTVAAGNLINDYFDIESDKLNHPYRALPMKIVSTKVTLIYFFLFNFAAYVFSLFLGFFLFIYVLFVSVLLYLYSYKLKSIPLLGNVIVAFLTGLAFLYGSIIVDNINSGIFPMVFAIMINLMRELIKDIKDIEGDGLSGIITFPIKFGMVNTVNLVSTIGFLLILLTLFPFFMSIYNIKYFIIVLFVNGIILFVIKSLQTDVSRYNLSLSTTLLKITMVIGIIAILMGSKF